MSDPGPLLGWLLTALALGWTIRSAAGASAVAGRPDSPADQAGTTVRTRGATPFAWYVVVALAAVALRWPAVFVRYELNPDESQSLAGALTLWHDPRFWISVDGATAGPVHFFALMPAVLAPGIGPYVVSRLMALGLTLATFILAGRWLARASSTIVEQLVVLPAVVALAVSTAPDFQHFSTEVVPGFLIVLAATLALDEAPSGPGRGRVWITGILLGLVPLAKLQAGPIALLIGLIFTVRLYRTHQRSAVIIAFAAALLPVCVVAIYLTLANAWQSALIPYYYNNLAYVNASQATVSKMLPEFVTLWWAEGALGTWLLASLALLLVLPAWSAERTAPLRRLTLVAAGWCAVACVCIVAPRRPVLHYFQFMLVPWLLLTGGAVGAWWTRMAARPARSRALMAAALFAITLTPVAAVRYAGTDGFRYVRLWFTDIANTTAAMSDVIARYQRPGDTLAVWGNQSQFYLTTRMPQAVPQAHTETQIVPGPWQAYFLRTYFEHFSHNRPAVFVDAVGEGNLSNQRENAHEAFALLRNYVAQNYTLVAQQRGVRVYVRNDRVTPMTGAPR